MNVKGFSVNDDLWNALRDCQKNAITTALGYVKQRSHNNKSCLLSLPTGAGKSGVITVVAHKARQRKTLVLCHRRAICDQLHRDVDRGFAAKLVPDGNAQLNKTVVNGISDLDSNGVYLTTFQKLTTLNKTGLATLREHIDLLIVDEGHSEPSPAWRKIVRSIEAPKIVVTATPYRNDLFQFDICADHSYIHTFSAALDDEVLKEPRFRVGDSTTLVADIQSFLDENPGTKCIVKCKQFSDVEQYYDLLNDHFSILAVHEQFKNDARDNVKTHVPNDLKDSEYQVIIHQKKIDEGVDIPQAKLLVLTYPVASGRELVQTVGRVVRLHEDVEPVVIELANNSNKHLWENYRSFDSTLNEEPRRKKFLESLDTSRLLDKYLGAFPESSYYNRKFRDQFDLNTFNPERSLIIPRASVCFFERPNNFSVQNLTDDLFWLLNDEGELAKVFPSDNELYVLISVSFNSSKYLKDTLFFEPTLNVMIIKEMGDILAIFDSRNKKLHRHEELSKYFGSVITQDQLLKVSTLGERSATKEASSKSISTAKRRPESIAIKGKNLEDMANTQSNASYRLSTLKLDNFDRTDRKQDSFYIGIDNGRISDEKNKDFTLHELDQWLESIKDSIVNPGTWESNLLQSYAKPVDAIPTGSPERVIFDLSSYESEIHFSCNGQIIDVSNSYIDYEYNDGFCLIDGDDRSKVLFSYSEENKAAEFSNQAEMTYSFCREDLINDEPTGYVSELLEEHFDRALFSDGICLSGENVFQHRLPSQDGFELSRSNLANVIIGMTELLSPNMTEKDEANTRPDDFSSDSVFHLVDQLKEVCDPAAPYASLGPFAQYIPAMDLLCCTDMGPEPADFIISSPTKLVFVQIKCGSRSQPHSSAGALAEVGSQAVKNLEMLTSTDHDLSTGNWTYIGNPWPQNSAVNKLDERLRVINGERFRNINRDPELRNEKLDDMWATITSRRASPSVEKEVWIIAANSFSLEHFAHQMRCGANASPTSLQAYQLIQSWLATAYDLDAHLKIFVSP